MYEHIDDKSSKYDKKTLDAIPEDEIEEVKNPDKDEDVEVEIEEADADNNEVRCLNKINTK